jgi:Tol biopolymer transport system component
MQTFVVRVSLALVVMGVSLTFGAWAQSTRIAFSSTQNGDYEIYSRREDGTGERQLTNFVRPDDRPSICPDGRAYVFDRYPESTPYTWDIMFVGQDGTGLTNLTNTEWINENDPDCGSPVDGVFRILYVRSETCPPEPVLTDNTNEIYLRNIDGSGTPVQLTDNCCDDREPAWCGASVIFASNRDPNDPESCDCQETYDIYTMSDGGTGVVNRTNDTDEDRYPSCDVLGTKFAWAHDDGAINGYLNIHTMNIDGSSPETLPTGNDWNEIEPTWAPSGTVLAYTKQYENSEDQIWMINADKTANTAWAFGGSVHFGSPDWGPAVLSP